ncbi:hypothetical protein C4D60_Mb10t06980 [Musa balbisiana]|uniref:Uncharacterized protein n=1 Tax=Musa balbisiana TaxID=52838 RepID=A0A4S8IV74_MUSBA|nr:hypothetical protein C4D60_Mb10t06980 [Musa balbisiana]
MRRPPNVGDVRWGKPWSIEPPSRPRSDIKLRLGRESRRQGGVREGERRKKDATPSGGLKLTVLLYSCLTRKTLAKESMININGYAVCLSISSSYGQTLTTSAFVGETLFSILIVLVGLVLFAHLIGNKQTSLQNLMTKNLNTLQRLLSSLRGFLYEGKESVGKRCSDINQLKMWMCHRLLLLLRPLRWRTVAGVR